MATLYHPLLSSRGNFEIAKEVAGVKKVLDKAPEGPFYFLDGELVEDKDLVAAFLIEDNEVKVYREKIVWGDKSFKIQNLRGFPVEHNGYVALVSGNDVVRVDGERMEKIAKGNAVISCNSSLYYADLTGIKDIEGKAIGERNVKRLACLGEFIGYEVEREGMREWYIAGENGYALLGNSKFIAGSFPKLYLVKPTMGDLTVTSYMIEEVDGRPFSVCLDSSTFDLKHLAHFVSPEKKVLWLIVQNNDGNYLINSEGAGFYLSAPGSVEIGFDERGNTYIGVKGEGVFRMV